MTLPRTLLVPIDFSDHADRALDYAVELAAHLDATLHVVHAVSVVPMSVPELGGAYGAQFLAAATAEAETALDERVSARRDRATFAAPRVEVGDAREVIEHVAAAIEADLIVMGTHGRRGFRRALLGSVAESVVRSAPCPVLTIRPKPPGVVSR